MTLQEIIDRLQLTIITEKKDFSSIQPTSGYASDLLSCVMAGAKKDGIWVTLQAHINIIAVAALLELSAIVVTEGAEPDPSVVQKANDQGVILLVTPQPTFTVAGRLWEMGLRAEY